MLGYTGPTCSFVVDHCLSNPCIHGVCLNQQNGSVCICSAGYAPDRLVALTIEGYLTSLKWNRLSVLHWSYVLFY